MPRWLDTLHDFGDILATDLGVREHLYRLKSDRLYRIVSDDRRRWMRRSRRPVTSRWASCAR